jgi:hypothetical protein
MDETGPSEPIDIMTLFPNAQTGTVEPPHIVTMEELMASHAVIVECNGACLELICPWREAVVGGRVFCICIADC